MLQRRVLFQSDDTYKVNHALSTEYVYVCIGNKGVEQSLYFSSNGSPSEMKIWIGATEVANIYLLWRIACGCT